VSAASGKAAPGAALRSVFPGLVVSAMLATIAFLLADQPLFKDTLHLSALLLVILVGMALRTIMQVPDWAAPGVRMAQRPVLRWAVAGLGFRLSLGEILKIGVPALAVVVTSVFAALVFGWWVGRRLGLNDKLATLLAVGGGICGASAVVAADSVVQAEKSDSALAVGIITLLGTIGIVIYPWIGRAAAMDTFRFGVWDGASLHEMAQVVAAASGFARESTAIATVVKLVRICLLAPVVFFLAWRMRALTHSTDAGRPQVSPVPWFLVVFVLFAAINSTGWLPKDWVQLIQRGDLWLLCVGMAGVGLQTSFHDLGRAGWGPIAAGVAQWIALAGISYGLATLLVR
jgi:uncharacterized integral membrane protein (TIGR00698 family)